MPFDVFIPIFSEFLYKEISTTFVTRASCAGPSIQVTLGLITSVERIVRLIRNYRQHIECFEPRNDSSAVRTPLFDRDTRCNRALNIN